MDEKIKKELKERYKIDSVRFIFEIAPCSAPRMTRSDKWKTNPNHADPRKRQRECVRKYFAYKKEFKLICMLANYKLEKCIDVCFVIEMPESWSEKKKKLMDFTLHEQRPDRDNMLKALQDSFDLDDGIVSDGRTLKIWGRKGLTIIF